MSLTIQPAHRQRSAGAVLMRGPALAAELLLIRRRARVHELPKGRVEPGESDAAAARRELCEETGLVDAPEPGPLLAELGYRWPEPPIDKVVRYFLFAADRELVFAAAEPGTRARVWITAADVDSVPLTSENLRPLLREAFARYPRLRAGPLP